jgi:uncharacterized protein YfaS (alpha-2-macroglobulin family)
MTDIEPRVESDRASVSYVDSIFSGRVTAGGAPISGAVVVLVDTAGQETARSHSAADGTFRLRVPTHGRYLLFVTAAEHQPVMDLVEAGRGGGLREIVLERLDNVISGVVTDSRFGRPVAGASVALTDERGVVVQRVVTGADGRYAFPALLAGDYSIVVSGHAPAVSSASLTPGQRAELDLTLPQSA